MMTKVKTPAEIAAMRRSGQMLGNVLAVVRQQVRPGVTTKELAELAARQLAKLGGQPAFKGYQGFPDVLCVSVNDEVVHGIPSTERVLQAGDMVGLDFGVVYQGMVTDGAITVIVGQPEDSRQARLVADTEQALQAGIAAIKAGGKVGDISAAVQQSLQKTGRHYGIVRDLVGHGVGHELHEAPNIPNYGRPNTGPILEAGMTVAIEPMVTLGGEAVYLAPDQWTIKTRDGSRAAHFEHTILITDEGAEILTNPQ